MSAPRIPRLWGRQQAEPKPTQFSQFDADDQEQWSPDDWVGAACLALAAIVVGVAAAERYGWALLALIGVGL